MGPIGRLEQNEGCCQIRMLSKSPIRLGFCPCGSVVSAYTKPHTELDLLVSYKGDCFPIPELLREHLLIQCYTGVILPRRQREPLYKH